jgi:hypothetical protein
MAFCILPPSSYFPSNNVRLIIPATAPPSDLSRQAQYKTNHVPATHQLSSIKCVCSVVPPAKPFGRTNQDLRSIRCLLQLWLGPFAETRGRRILLQKESSNKRTSQLATQTACPSGRRLIRLCLRHSTRRSRSRAFCQCVSPF